MSKLEIERRFLFNSCNVDKLFKKKGISYIISSMEQFYLKATKEETLRFRREDNRYIKNIKKGSGLVREEFEEEITKVAFEEAKNLNLGSVIKKNRYMFIIDGNRYELDIFKGQFKGLSILEIEFKNLKEAQRFKIPKILDNRVIKEITNESIYSNGALSRSGKIPLRNDSYISLKEIIKEKSIAKKTRFDLYISEYENTSLAFKNYIERFLNSFNINYATYLKTKDLKSLLLAIKSIKRIKSLSMGFKNYIDSKIYLNILFNINNFLLNAEEIVALNRSFKTLLKNKSKFEISTQTDILKLLIKIAQELKEKKENFENCFNLKDVKKLNIILKNLQTYNLDIPFVYAKEKILTNELKNIKKLHKQNSSKEEIALEYKRYRDLCKFFNVKIKKNSFNSVNRVLNYLATNKVLQNIEFYNHSLKDNLLSYFNKSIKLKKLYKILNKKVCNAN